MAGKNFRNQRIEPRFSATPGNLTRPGAEKLDGVAAKPAGQRLSRKGGSKKNRSGRLRKFAYWSFVLAIWAALGLAGIIGYYTVKLPQSSAWAVPKRPPNAKIVSVDGMLVANRGVTGGEAMLLSEISPYIPMAVIAIEDRRFNWHFGIDPIGLTRAMAANLMAGRLVQGGSTLTQQLAKNLFLEPDRNLERKVQEAVLALWLEHKFTKDEILELYLNRVYFGSGAYGVDAAARRYFNKSARDVNLAEAAILAGLLKAPSKLSPARNPKGAEERAQLVLTAMRRAGFVSDREVAAALSMEAKQAKRFWSGSQHYVADMVMKELPGLIGDLNANVIVDTTIDLDLQKEAGDAIADAIARDGDKHDVSQGALIAMDGTGAIRALVGGVEYADSQFNRAVDAKRQPGSAFKPVVYLTAVEHGRTPETVRIDRPIRIGKWTPENYDRKYRGPVTLSEGLSQSLNTIAAQLVSEVGARRVSETAKRLGIGSQISRNASIALGTSEVSLMELTAAYAPFANGGHLTKPYLIKRVTTLDGKVVYERRGRGGAPVVDSRAVGMMNAMLRRTVAEGTGKAARIAGWQVAGKTGTSQNFRDALFIGYTANLVTGVWFGNDDGKPTKKATGGSIPARTFAAFMESAHKGVPVAELPGHYLPQTIAIVPTPRPVAGAKSNRPLAGMRRPLRDLFARKRPGAAGEESGDAGQKKRPRRILDLLLGG